MATPGQLQMYNKMEVDEMFGLDHRAMDSRINRLDSMYEQSAVQTKSDEDALMNMPVTAEKDKEEKKEDIKEEKKEGAVKKENGAENGKDKEKKEKKEKKDKSEKKDKKDKKDQKDGAAVKKEAGTAKTTPPLLKKTTSEMDLDHRKLFKEGQRFLTPPMADSTRAFYESLLQENPESKIAIKFCVEYGLMPLEEHKRLLKKYLHLKERGVYDMRTQIKRALEKKAKRGEKEKKDKKEKKEKKDGEKKEKKEKEDKDKAPAA